MIVHRYHDGSEGYEYELGDVVVIHGVVPYGKWFQDAIGRTGPVVELEGGSNGAPRCRHVSALRVRDLPNWGPSLCKPWQVKPTEATRATAKIVDVTPGGAAADGGRG